MESRSGIGSYGCLLFFLAIAFGIGYYCYSQRTAPLVEQGRTIADDYRWAEKMREIVPSSDRSLRDSASSSSSFETRN